jgi:hypothetical protein
VLAKPALEARKKRIARVSIQRGERLVQQQQAGQGRKRTRESYPLCFAAGEVLRAARGEIPCINQRQHLVDSPCLQGAIKSGKPVCHVGGHAHVWKQRSLLRNERDVSASGMEVKASNRVRQRLPVKRDSPIVWPIEPGQQTQ